MDLKEKTYIVTGASTGIGSETAKLLASHGANVAVTYARDKASADATAEACKALGADVLVLQGDVSEDAACRRIVDETVARWGRLDGLVNNAGMTKFVSHAKLDGLSMEDFQRLYAVNVVGVFQMTRAAEPHLRASGKGAVVNVSSVAGVMGGGSSIAYAASKGALNTMTMSLARVLAPEVRVNAVCPGLVETGFWAGQIDDKHKQAIADNYVKAAVLRRFSSPEEQAMTILFLLTGDPNITGQVIVSDSGMHLR